MNDLSITVVVPQPGLLLNGGRGKKTTKAAARRVQVVQPVVTVEPEEPVRPVVQPEPVAQPDPPMPAPPPGRSGIAIRRAGVTTLTVVPVAQPDQATVPAPPPGRTVVTTTRSKRAREAVIDVSPVESENESLENEVVVPARKKRGRPPGSKNKPKNTVADQL